MKLPPLPHVTLASKSPRRKALLDIAQIKNDVLSIDVDESFSEDTPVEEVAEMLAKRKAEAAVSLYPDKLFLTADSVVIHRGKIYEKPVDREDAIRIIQSLAGSVHEVITGVCIREGDRIVSFSDRSEVHLSEMTIHEIEWYVDQWEPYDKAGAYGIQDWIGHCKVRKIIGTYDTIMGLPTDRVYRTLAEWNA